MRDNQVKTLYFSVRLRLIRKYMGQLLFIYAILTTVPLVFSLAIGEFDLSMPYIVIIAGAGAAGFFMQRIKTKDDLQNNESLVISALVFLVASLLSAIPFYQLGLTFTDALFEAVSGVTTTGLTCLLSVEPLPRTFQFARTWLQWVGGLGIVVLSVAIILPQSKVTLQLFRENWEKEGYVAGTRSYARVILQVYFLLTLAGFVLLMLMGVDWFAAITHVLAAVSTGGFSTYDDSLAGLQSFSVQAVVIALSLLGATPFIIYYMTIKVDWRKLTANLEIRGLVIVSLLAVLSTIVALNRVDGLPLQQSLQDGTLLALSAQSTTGFSTTPISGLSDVSKLLLVLFMFVGGNVGSTAGGIKILRLLIILKMIGFFVARAGLSQNAVVQPRMMGRRLESIEIERCFILVFLFIAVIMLSWFPFLLLGFPPLDSLFEVVSATCTVGLSTGISSPELPGLLKLVLCLDMLLGRLEIVAFLIMVYPFTWFGKKREV